MAPVKHPYPTRSSIHGDLKKTSDIATIHPILIDSFAALNSFDSFGLQSTSPWSARSSGSPGKHIHLVPQPSLCQSGARGRVQSLQHTVSQSLAHLIRLILLHVQTFSFILKLTLPGRGPCSRWEGQIGLKTSTNQSPDSCKQTRWDLRALDWVHRFLFHCAGHPRLMFCHRSTCHVASHVLCLV